VHKGVIRNRFAIKGCCIWLDILDPQQLLSGGLPFRQVAVTVQFKMVSKMTAAVLCPHCKKTHAIFFLLLSQMIMIFKLFSPADFYGNIV